MAKISLTGLSVKDLIQLRSDIDTAITERKESEKAELKRKMSELAAKSGLSLADILGVSRKGGRKGSTVAPKYRNPDNPRETWAGRGRQPRWLSAKLKKGANIADFAI